MEMLQMHEWHQSHNATLIHKDGVELVQSYGDPLKEHSALWNTAGVLDLSFRGRLCITGDDRIRYLNGQVTNNVKALPPRRGCYAALTTARGKMESDLHIHCLPDELLIDFEPGLSGKLKARLEQYIVSDDVEVVELRSHYGLLSVQGPKAIEVMQQLALPIDLPETLYQSITLDESHIGEIVMINLPRFGVSGFDLFIPTTGLATMADRLYACTIGLGGCAAGWEAMEMARIEAGVPRYGQDMDESNIPLEAGLEARAISYSKGCYIGQEVINRIHSIGQVSKALRGLHLTSDSPDLPKRGDKLFHEGREVGYITSALCSPRLDRRIALCYVRREVNQTGAPLSLPSVGGTTSATIVDLPFAVS